MTYDPFLTFQAVELRPREETKKGGGKGGGYYFLPFLRNLNLLTTSDDRIDLLGRQQEKGKEGKGKNLSVRLQTICGHLNQIEQAQSAISPSTKDDEGRTGDEIRRAKGGGRKEGEGRFSSKICALSSASASAGAQPTQGRGARGEGGRGKGLICRADCSQAPNSCCSTNRPISGHEEAKRWGKKKKKEKGGRKGGKGKRGWNPLYPHLFLWSPTVCGWSETAR